MATDMYEKMDQVMEDMHQVVSYLIDYAKAEKSGKKITEEEILNNKILNSLFRKIQKSYRELQDVPTNQPEKSTINKLLGDPQFSNKMNYLELSNYLHDSYVNLRYISREDDEESKNISDMYDDIYDYVHDDPTEEPFVIGFDDDFSLPCIYKNTEAEKLRAVEVALQQKNLDDIIKKSKFNENTDRLSFTEKSYVLSYIADEKFYDYELKQANQYLADIEKNKEFSDEQRDLMKDTLIESKYIMYLSKLNHMYNGVLQKGDIGKTANAKTYLDQGAENIILNMPQSEINAYINTNVKNLLKKYSVRDELMKIIQMKKIEKENKIEDKADDEFEYKEDYDDIYFEK